VAQHGVVPRYSWSASSNNEEWVDNARLHVITPSGNFFIMESSSQIKLRNNTSGTENALFGMDAFASGQLGLGTTTAHPFALYTNGARRLNVQADGGIGCPEIAAPAGTAGFDVFYCDSTVHWPFVNPNSTGFVKLLTAGSGANNPLQTQSTAGCATAASLNATCTTTITWPNAFADTNYKVTGCMGNAITSGVPALQVITAKAAASITVRTISLTAAAAQFTNIECGAVHN